METPSQEAHDVVAKAERNGADSSPKRPGFDSRAGILRNSITRPDHCRASEGA